MLFYIYKHIITWKCHCTHTHTICSIYMYVCMYVCITYILCVQWYIQVILFIICYGELSKFVVLSHLRQQWSRTEITIQLLALLPEYGSFPLFLRPWVPDTSPWPSAKYSALKITTSLHSLSLSVLMFLDFDVAFIAPDGHNTVYKHWYNCVTLINHMSQNIYPVSFSV